MNTDNQLERIDSGLLLGGFVIGLIVGGIVTLFRAPRSGSILRQELSERGDAIREKLDTVIQSDPMAESMAEGKAAAHRRRIELGFND
jgi:gas vesicle protein